MHESDVSQEAGWQLPTFEAVEFREKRSRYCICVPVLNEDGRIKAQLERMRPFSDQVDIIIADGGSTDGSLDNAFLKQHNVRTLLTLTEKGRQGTQLRMAFAYALRQGYKGILQVDGNNKDGVEAIPRFIKELEDGVDYVQGSRFIRGGEHINTPIVRHLAVRLLASPIISLGARRWSTDVTNGFRGYSRAYLLHPDVQPFRDIFVRYELILYLAVRANRLGLKSKEIPVRRAYPSGKIPTKISRFSGNSNLLSTLIKVAMGSYDPRRVVMRSYSWLPLLALFGIAFALYSPSLIGNRIFFDFDTLTGGYGYAAHFSGQAWADAQYTNAYHSGANLGSNPIFNLYGLLFTLKPTIISDTTFFHWLVFAFYSVFLAFTYVFFRDRGFRPWLAAGLTALIAFSERYVLTFFPLLYVGTYLVFPAFCVVLLRLRRHFKLTTMSAGGALTAFACLFGYMPLLLLIAIPLAAYTAFLFWGLLRENWKAARRFVCGLIAIAAIGIACSFWQLSSVYHLAQDTPRGGGLSFVESQEEVLHPTDLPRLVLPAWSLYSSTEGALYMSLLGLVFLICSFRTKHKDRETTFWHWTLFLGLAFAVMLSPLAWVMNKLPLYDSLRAPSRTLFFVLFAAAFLAGRGIEAFLAEPETFRKGKLAAMVRFSLLVLLTVIVMGTVFDLVGGFQVLAAKLMTLFDARYYGRTTGLPIEHYHNVIVQMVDGVRASVSARNAATAVAAATILSAYLILFRSRARERQIAIALIVSSAMYASLRVLPSQDVTVDVIRETPGAATYIRSQTDHDQYRAFSLFYASSKFEDLDTPLQGHASHEDQVVYARDLLAVNMHLRYGVQSIDGYDNFMTRRTSALLNEVMSESMPSGNRIAQSDKTRAEKIDIFTSRLNILGMMNVKHVLTTHELKSEKLKLVWSGDTTSQRIPVHVYENTDVLPRVFLAHRVVIVPSDESVVLDEVLKPGRDFHQETLLECDDCSLIATTSTKDRAEIASYAPGDVRITASTSQPRLLVLNENRLRGWQATVDGNVVSSYFTNYLYQGVIVPAGTHDVRFTYVRP